MTQTFDRDNLTICRRLLTFLTVLSSSPILVSGSSLTGRITVSTSFPRLGSSYVIHNYPISINLLSTQYYLIIHENT